MIIFHEFELFEQSELETYELHIRTVPTKPIEMFDRFIIYLSFSLAKLFEEFRDQE